MHHILSRPGESWVGMSGHIDAEATINTYTRWCLSTAVLSVCRCVFSFFQAIVAVLPPVVPETRVLVCGQIPFNRDMQLALQSLGFERDQVFTF